jgi:hypothetical protein
VCVCVKVRVYACMWVSTVVDLPLRLYVCVRARPTALCREGHGGPACVCPCPCLLCVCVCSCVSDSLLSLSVFWHGRGLLSHTHTLTHAAWGGAGGGTERQAGSSSSSVVCAWVKGTLGCCMDPQTKARLRWAQREREARGRGGVPCVSAMATKFNSAQQICQTKLSQDGTFLKYGPPLPPSRLWGEGGLCVCVCVCVCVCMCVRVWGRDRNLKRVAGRMARLRVCILCVRQVRATKPLCVHM